LARREQLDLDRALEILKRELGIDRSLLVNQGRSRDGEVRRCSLNLGLPDG
jgi:hypothetical protein